jgi:hypothetical protein
VADGGGRRLVQRSLGEGLGLHPEGDWWTLVREQRTGLEYIRRSADLCRDGLYVELHAYGCQVFLDIREVHDGPSGRLRRLAEKLGGRGVPSVGAALREMQLAPLQDALRDVAAAGALLRLAEAGAARGAAAGSGGAGDKAADPVAGALTGVTAVLRAVADITGSAASVDEAAAAFGKRLGAALRLNETARDSLGPRLAEVSTWQTLLAGLVVEAAAAVGDTDELQLCPIIAADLVGTAGTELIAAALHRLPVPSSVAELPPAERAPALARALLSDEAVRAAIGVHVWEGVTYFDRDAFERLLWWLRVIDGLAALAGTKAAGTKAAGTKAAARAPSAAALKARLAEAERLATVLARAGEACGYQVDKLEAATATV